MSSTTIPRETGPAPVRPASERSLLRRFFGVVTDPLSYRNIAYLLLGLPLGTIWFTLLVTGFSVAISMIVVALLGIPMLLGMWYASRACANIERAVTESLLGHRLAPASLVTAECGNLWVRLRSMSGDRDRWHEMAFLLLRFPVGVATFSAAVAALATPLAIGYAPFEARWGGDDAFGSWRHSSTLEDIASSPWAWLFAPLGVVLLTVAFHALNALARACGRWAAAQLTIDGDARTPEGGGVR